MEQGKSGTHQIVRPITCPQCQGKGSFDTWDCMDITENPELRERVIHDPMLFFYYCPKCFSRIRIDTPCLYIDRERQFLIWLIPDRTMRMTPEELHGFLGAGTYDGYRCRIVRSWGEWREKIIEMESPYDDLLYEMVKNGAFRLLKKEEQESFYMPAYHVDYKGDDEKANDLTLIFMRDNEEKTTYSYPIAQKVMELSQDIFLPMLKKMADADETGTFRHYDYAWADRVVTNMLDVVAKNGSDHIKKFIALWFQMIGTEIFQAEIKN